MSANEWNGELQAALEAHPESKILVWYEDEASQVACVITDVRYNHDEDTITVRVYEE